jgi:hypothetical protein
MNKTEINVEFEGDICALDFAWSLEIIKTTNKFRDTAYTLRPIFRGAKLITFEKETETNGIVERSSTPVEIIAELDACEFEKAIIPTGASYLDGSFFVYFGHE